MEILLSGRLRKTMNDSKARRKEYGELAEAIGRRLDDLRAIATLADAFQLPGRFEPLAGNRLGEYSMRLSPNHRLILAPANDVLPKTRDGGVDLNQVTAVRILGVEDYHKK